MSEALVAITANAAFEAITAVGIGVGIGLLALYLWEVLVERPDA